MRSIVLFSGGPDSLITLEYVRLFHKSVTAVYFDLGHKYVGNELLAVRDCMGFSGVDWRIESSVLTGLGGWEQSDGYIYHRNAFLVLAASKMIPWGESGTIWLTTQKDEIEISDRTPKFMSAMSSLLQVLGTTIYVSTPWISVDKTDMVQWYLKEVSEAEDRLKRTWSCYTPVDRKSESGGHIQCGNCTACIRRYIAFSLNGIQEEYAEDPKTSLTGQAYVDKAKCGVYSSDRNQRILKALCLD